MSDLRPLLADLREGRLGPEQQRALAAGLSPAPRRRRLAWPLAAGLAVVALVFAAGELTAPPTDSTFATVNGQSVNYGAFYTALQDASGSDVATKVVLQAAMRQEATRLGCLPTDTEVDQRLKEIIADEFPNEEALRTWMAEKGADQAALRRLAADDVLDLRLRAFASLNPTDEALRTWFKENHAKVYDEPDTVKFRELVLDTKEQAVKVLAELDSGKIEFVTAVGRYSNAESKADGGLVGPQPLPALEELAPDLVKELRKLSPLQYTKQPVPVKDRWFIVLMVERKEGKQAKYEDVAGHLKHDYLVAKATPAAEYYGKLAKAATVTVAADRWKPVQAQFGPEGALTRFTKPAAGGDK